MAVQHVVSDVALKAGEPWGYALIIATLTDLNGTPVTGHLVGQPGVEVQQHRIHADPITGNFDLHLYANADITPVNTYYTVTIGAGSTLIDVTGDGTLASLEAVAPDPLGPAAATTTALAAEVARATAAEDDLQDQINGIGPGGAVSSVNGEVGAVTLDAGDIPSTPFGTIAATDVQAALEEIVAEASTGAVDSVNGDTGVVVLDATDVGALPITGGTVTGSVTLDDGAGGASLTVMGGNGIALDAGIPDQATFLFPGGMEFDNSDLGFGLNAAAFFLDGNKRFRIDSDGALRWSTSTGVDDTALESNAGVLELDGSPVATAADLTGLASSASLTTETNARIAGDASSVSTAASDATTKANAAQAAAIATAASDATTKANAAQAAAISTASSDATSKANAAQAAAIAASQPVDADLTAIAALASTSYGRALLTLADQAAIMALLSAASLTAQGIVELATTTEATTGTDAVRAVTAAGVKAVIDAHAAATDPHADRAYADTADLAVSTAFAALITAIETTTKNWTGALTLNAALPVLTLGDGTAGHGTITSEIDNPFGGRVLTVYRDGSGVSRCSVGWSALSGAALTVGGLIFATPDAAGSATAITMPTNGIDVAGSGGLRIPAAANATEALRRSDGDSRYNPNALTGPTGAVAETMPRWITVANVTPLTTQILWVQGVQLRAGQTVTNIVWVSRTTALSGGNHQWAVLLDSSRVVKAVSADGTSGAWAANTFKSFAMGTPFPVVTSGFYYLGIMVDATTVPSLAGMANATNLLTNQAPIMGGASSTGQTTPPSLAATMGAITAAGAGLAYAYAT